MKVNDLIWYDGGTQVGRIVELVAGNRTGNSLGLTDAAIIVQNDLFGHSSNTMIYELSLMEEDGICVLSIEETSEFDRVFQASKILFGDLHGNISGLFGVIIEKNKQVGWKIDIFRTEKLIYSVRIEDRRDSL